MAKLTKRQLTEHRAAAALVELDRPLTLDERLQVAEHWHEGAGGDQTAASAFFTPCEMASDLRIDMPACGSFVDLCAGIGRLAFFAGGQALYEEFRHRYDRIVCVEKNPAYVAVGRRILPEAEWICGDIFDPEVIRQVGRVDQAILNPPFGHTTKTPFEAPRYRGADFDLKAMDLAATLAPAAGPSSRVIARRGTGAATARTRRTPAVSAMPRVWTCTASPASARNTTARAGGAPPPPSRLSALARNTRPSVPARAPSTLRRPHSSRPPHSPNAGSWRCSDRP